MAVLIFLAVLFVLILVHEWGHFIVAKKMGMQVDEFAIGFPPRVVAKKIGETVYSLNIFPIGGYVKILGENGAETPHEQHGDTRSGRSFSEKSKWAQAAVLVAGVAMNVVLAFVLFAAALMIGTQTAVTEADATDAATLVVAEVLPDGPAGRAELRPGTRVTEVRTDDTTLVPLTPSAFQTFVSTHADKEITILYTQGNETIETKIMAETNVIADDPARAAVGVALVLVEKTALPAHEAVVEAGAMTIVQLRAITVGISGLLWDAVRLDADLAEVAGPIGIVGLVGDASAFGITTLLRFIAFISLNLAVINLLPFPALDGGRLLFVLIEAVKGSPIRPAWAGALNTLGFILLILLMIAVTISDVTKILS